MKNSESSTHRRRFLKSVVAGVAIGSSGVQVRLAEGADNQKGQTPASFPEIAKGEVLRTDGELVAENALRESARTIPVAGRSDVLVCGGGPAGIGAALAAARAGASVQLIEVGGCLGGVWTAGLLTKILNGGGKAGVMQELLSDLAERGSSVARETSGTVYDPELMKLLLEEKCIEAGVKIQLHTRLVGTVTNQKNQIVAIITESKSGRQAWVAQRFIDCSGDGDLAAQAGCQFDVGIGSQCECQPMSLIALLTGIEPSEVTEFIRENGSAAKSRLLKLMRGAGIKPSYRAPTLRHLHSGIFSLMTNHEYGVSATDAGQVTEATIRARAEVHAIVHDLRKLGGPWSNLAVVSSAEQIGVREGRRIRGRYTITGNDIITGLRHKDAVCRANFAIDVHNVFPDGSNPADVKRYRSAGVKAYDIPLPALIAADVDGLMMAGRCISGDFIAHSSYRVTGNSVPMGEAAGLTSVASLKQGVMPHELSWDTVQKAT
ncbi:FAD-dependent oxidoreductase [Symmachiella dynata]|uniref:FAD-dependent oxidoreductase n=1 Tax=Symmachiella dynata TaxID=2527995 RepID=UPI00119CA342|nr:FAD-dependent oxidoreductase [Symmachiella dynata]